MNVILVVIIELGMSHSTNIPAEPGLSWLSLRQQHDYHSTFPSSVPSTRGNCSVGVRGAGANSRRQWKLGHTYSGSLAGVGIAIGPLLGAWGKA